MKVTKKALEKIEKRVLRELDLKFTRESRAKGLIAYHQVFGAGSLDRILEEGFIYPGIYRLDPEWLRGKCERWIAEDLRWEENPEMLDALLFVVERAVEDLKEFREEKGIVAGSTATQLECVDVIFGDAWNVFLSPHEMRFAGSEDALVFDAFDLVDRGAALRMTDFIDSYRTMTQDLLYGKTDYENVRDPVKRIMKAVKEVKGNEMRGKWAIQELVSMTINEGLNYGADIVWNGPLPVRWAKEVVRGGRSISL